MIDQPNRPTPRFPPQKEAAVKAQILATLNTWQMGPADIAICGGARGADLLFAEAALTLGAQVEVLLPLPEPEFLQRSVELPGSHWRERFFAVINHPHTHVFFLEEFLKNHPEVNLAGDNSFAQNNLWIIHTAIAAQPPDGIFALLVWDEQGQGDGPGGTADFAEKIRQVHGVAEIINPTKIY
jgi:hypothetical protein